MSSHSNCCDEFWNHGADSSLTYVHLLVPCQMDPIMSVAERYNIFVVENFLYDCRYKENLLVIACGMLILSG